jgi:hypothetical protein
MCTRHDTQAKGTKEDTEVDAKTTQARQDKGLSEKEQAQIEDDSSESTIQSVHRQYGDYQRNSTARATPNDESRRVGGR